MCRLFTVVLLKCQLSSVSIHTSCSIVPGVSATGCLPIQENQISGVPGTGSDPRPKLFVVFSNAKIFNRFHCKAFEIAISASPMESLWL